MKSNENALRGCFRALKIDTSLVLAVVAVVLATGCATPQVKPAYPAVEAGMPASVLKLENTMGRMSRLPLKVTVDGFSPVEKSKLKKSGPFLPSGITEVRVPAGSHVLEHQGEVESPYYFNPVKTSFETEEGKTYVVRFRSKNSLMQLRYTIEYEGWSTEECAQWPNQVNMANPLFGR